ncbi:hypothetical protein SAMN05443245_3581 [Paraburkholderia fungorum]|uniref:Uncharacterized protein n=1 Tax=Paraburkholderia fungorum TaxID=134537 RepID=A0A1H1H6H6_9BURK|nr:hypothetical protein SAMN05443245_3581 [Paraburkholderia fungorum]
MALTIDADSFGFLEYDCSGNMLDCLHRELGPAVIVTSLDAPGRPRQQSQMWLVGKLTLWLVVKGHFRDWFAFSGRDCS